MARLHSREMLLFGAGASIEADVPGAYGMTRELIAQVEADPFHRRHAHLLRFVAGGLMFQSGVQGSDPFGGVNVEDLFNAVQLLGARSTLEAAPFVASWHPMVDEFDRTRPRQTDAKAFRRRLSAKIADDLLDALPSHLSSGSGRDIDRVLDARLKKAAEAAAKNRNVSFGSSESVGKAVAAEVRDALQNAFKKLKSKSRSASDDTQLSRALGDAVDQRQPRPAGGRLFEATNEIMVQLLADIVWIEDPERVAYLAPILSVLDDQPGLTVATLNYDNGVERLCESRSVSCETGIETWSEDGAFPDPEGGVNLLKLHGSIDWRLVDGQMGDDRPMPHTRIGRVGEKPKSYFHPALIFGQRNKLTARGPFLDLLRTFRERLAGAGRLTVVGYSFRDEHINEYVTQWLNGDASRRLRVIDPGFEASQDPYPVTLKRHCAGRLDVFSVPAGEGLAQAFG